MTGAKRTENACEQGTIGFGTFDKQSRNFAILNNILLGQMYSLGEKMAQVLLTNHRVQ